MENRTRLAVLLIALIMGANLTVTAYYQKKRAQENQVKRAAFVADSLASLPPAPAPGTAPGTASLPGATAAPGATATTPGGVATTPTIGPDGAPLVTDATAAPGFPVAGEDDGNLIVETPLQRFVLARAGGVVRSVQLANFSVYANGPVDLVPQAFQRGGAHALGLTLKTSSGEVSLDQARFDIDGDAGTGGTVRLAAGDRPRVITLRCVANGGGAVVKRFTFYPDQYTFDVEVAAEAGPGMPRIEAYSLEWTTGMPVTEQSPREDETRFRIVGGLDTDTVRKKATDFSKTESVTANGTIRYASLQNKYFSVAVIPAAPLHGTLDMLGQRKSHWVGMRLTQPAPWRSGSDSYRVYAGPTDPDLLRPFGVGLENTVELGWNWIRPISNAVLALMTFLSRFIPNYGVIIIIVSVLAKLLFWPLTERAFRSMRRMQDMQPRMEEIRRRYKDDPRGMNEQMMAMYREQKINPVGGCMPMLVQMPMFFALFSALQSSIELRNAPFISWIDNLSGPDILATLPTSLPVIGNHLSLLPFIMGGTMLWQAKLTPSMGGSGPQAAAMRQQQFLMRWVMPIMMTFIFYKMPSGLVIYWIVTTLMSIWQQTHINRKLGPPVTVGVVAKVENPGDKQRRNERLAGPGGSTAVAARQRSGRASGRGN